MNEYHKKKENLDKEKTVSVKNKFKHIWIIAFKIEIVKWLLTIW